MAQEWQTVSKMQTQTHESTLKPPWEICSLMSVRETTWWQSSFKGVPGTIWQFSKSNAAICWILVTGWWRHATLHPGSERHIPPRVLCSSTSTIWRLYRFRPSIIILRNSTVNQPPWRYPHYGHPGSTRYLTPNTWTQKPLGAFISTSGPSPTSTLNQVWCASAD